MSVRAPTLPVCSCACVCVSPHGASVSVRQCLCEPPRCVCAPPRCLCEPPLCLCACACAPVHTSLLTIMVFSRGPWAGRFNLLFRPPALRPRPPPSLFLSLFAAYFLARSLALSLTSSFSSSPPLPLTHRRIWLIRMPTSSARPCKWRLWWCSGAVLFRQARSRSPSVFNTVRNKSLDSIA